MTDKKMTDTELIPEPDETLFTFPCRFPVKVMGPKHDDFVEEVFTTVKKYDPGLKKTDLTLRESGKGNFLGLTVMITATSRAQLDAIYLALTSHPLVKVAL